jgi:hypothetical protein
MPSTARIGVRMSSFDPIVGKIFNPDGVISTGKPLAVNMAHQPIIPVIPEPAPIRYLLFSGENYYPSGGAEDFALKFSDRSDTLRFGMERFGKYENDWVHVFDLDTMVIIWGASIRNVNNRTAGERSEVIWEYDEDELEYMNQLITDKK